MDRVDKKDFLQFSLFVTAIYLVIFLFCWFSNEKLFIILPIIGWIISIGWMCTIIKFKK